MQGELARLMAESSAEIVKFRDQKASWFEEKKVRQLVFANHFDHFDVSRIRSET